MGILDKEYPNKNLFYKNKIPAPAGIIFGDAHQKYKNNLLIFL